MKPGESLTGQLDATVEDQKRRDGEAEDDGWLLAFVTDPATDHSELVVLDAHEVDAGPIARVKMERRVPLGFHANWFPDA